MTIPHSTRATASTADAPVPTRVASPTVTAFTAMFKGRSPATAADSVWVPLVSGILILVAGAMTLATGKPWLFAGLGPTAVMLAASPSHPTTRFHSIVLGHAVAIVCAWLAVLLLGAGTSAGLLSGQPSVARIWASAFAVAVTVLIQPSIRAYHPPAAATALLVTLGVYRLTWQNALALMGGVLAVALVGEWLRRVRLDGQHGVKRAA